MMELHLDIQSDNASLDEDTSALRQWSKAYLRSLDGTETPQGKKDRFAPRRLYQRMQAAGFVPYSGPIVLRLPMSPWKEGKASCPQKAHCRILTPFRSY